MKPAKSNRQPYQKRVFLLRDAEVAQRAAAAVLNAPIDELRALQVVIQEEPRKRSLDQNAAYHAGPLRDISEQVWLENRQFSADIFHRWFKEKWLPEDQVLSAEELALRVRDPETYKKWDRTPSGSDCLVGSTTQLTPFGFGEFMEQVCAFGAEHGVVFSVPDYKWRK